MQVPPHDRPRAQESASIRRSRARQTMRVGLIVLAIGAALLFTPLWLGARFGRFVAVAGIIGVCWGLGCILHGGWDWWQARSM